MTSSTDDLSDVLTDDLVREQDGSGLATLVATAPTLVPEVQPADDRPSPDGGGVGQAGPDVPAERRPGPGSAGPEGPGGRDGGGGGGDEDDRAWPAPLRTSVHRYGRLLALPLAVGVAVRLGLALTDDVITNDASAYLESGRNLVEGRGFVRDGGYPELHFPPGAPVLLGAAWRLTGSPQLALASITFLASSLCLLPLAALGRRIGGDRAGLAACWVAALAPGITSIPANAGGGSEPLYLLFLLVLLWLVSTLPSREGAGVWATAALAGLAGGALYLTRPEGLLLVLLVAAVAAVTSGVVGDLRRRRLSRRRLLRQLGPPTVLLAVLAGCMAPYLVFLHGHTGTWELTAKSQDANLEAWRAVADGDRHGRDRVLYELDDSGLGFVGRSESLAHLAREDPDGYADIVRINASQLWSEYVVPRPGGAVPLGHWALLPFPLTPLALWAGWRHRRDPTVLALLGVVGLATATCLGFFVQSRYLVPAVGVLCVLAGVGLVELRPRWRRIGLYGALVLLIVPVLVDIPRDEGIFAAREPVEHQLAGEWLADNTPVGSRIMTRSLVTEFYSARKAVALPFGSVDETIRFAYHHGVEYLVVDEFLMRRFRPQLAPLFEPGPWPGLRLVEGFRHDGRLTRIFELDPPPPVDSADPPGLGFVGDG